MGFFKNIFKRKKGGTFFGNLIRGVASTATGGLLGTGKDLAEWQSKTEQKEYQQALAENQRLIQQSVAFKQGSEIAQPFSQVITNSPEAKQLQNQQAKAWFTRNWWVVAIPLVSIIALFAYILNSKKKR